MSDVVIERPKAKAPPPEALPGKVSRKKPAPSGIPSAPVAKGASGTAVAVLLVKQTTAKAEQEEKERESLKDTLRRVEAFDRDSHLEFRRELENVRGEITATAKALDMGVTAYIGGDHKAASLYTMVSVWLALSMACEAGFAPNYDSPWSSICVAARDVNAAKATPKAPVKPGETPTVQTAAPTTRKHGKTKSGYEKAIKMLGDLPRQDLEKVAAWLQTKLAAK